MTTAPTTTDAPRIDPDRLGRFLETVIGDLSAAYGGVMIGIGDKLGLYEEMAGAGPISARELSDRSGCAERYVREWLNAQAAGGYVDYHPASGTYELGPEQEQVLANRESPYFIPPAWNVPMSMFLDEDLALEAFRSGEGISWGAHDDRLFRGVAAFYRNAYEASLTQSWIPALDDVEAKLTAGGRVADIGCGHGYSTIIMARAYPSSRFVGVDPHEPSIAAARAAASEAGVADRVRFEVGDAISHGLADLDLVCFFDCFHDLGDPIGAATAAAMALKPDGSVMLVEPSAGDRVEDNLTPVGRIYYAASTTLCCAHAIAEGAGDALGAQAGEARLADACRKGGLGRVRRAAETPFNIVLEARAGR